MELLATLLHGFPGETSTHKAQVQVPDSKVAMTRWASASEGFRHNHMVGSLTPKK